MGRDRWGKGGGGGEEDKVGTLHTAESVRGIGWRGWWGAIVPAVREQSSDIIKL